jgi:non-heme chloroperoxidase
MTSRRSMLGVALAAAGATALPLTARAAGTPAPARSGYIRTKDGVDLFVRDWGRGRPIILTHAWPLSSDCWEQQAMALADAGYRVISYDRRGFGRSAQPSTGYNYDTYADDLAAVIKATGVKDVTLAGYSMGGGEIVRYLSRHGGKGVVKVALVASVVPGLVKGRNNPQGVEPAFFEGLKDKLRLDRPTFLSGLLKDVFYDVQTSAASSNPVSQAVLDWSMQMAMQASLRALIGSVDAFSKADFVPDLGAVTMPTLVLHGSADKPVPLELTGRRAAAGIRQAKLVEYPGTSHGLLVTEGVRVTRDLRDWLAT